MGMSQVLSLENPPQAPPSFTSTELLGLFAAESEVYGDLTLADHYHRQVRTYIHVVLHTYIQYICVKVGAGGCNTYTNHALCMYVSLIDGVQSPLTCLPSPLQYGASNVYCMCVYVMICVLYCNKPYCPGLLQYIA